MKYKITGTPFPIVLCKLQPGESMICEKGAMAWMTDTISMKTNASGNFIARLLTKEKFFRNHYTAQNHPGTIAFRTSSPGEIIPINITQAKPIIAQKDAFIAATPSVKTTIKLQKLTPALFSGEGLIIQKFYGNGTLFLGINGTTVEHTLAPNESILMDTGTFAAAENTVTLTIQIIKGLTNIIAGGEGIFYTKATGPGKIWLQTMQKNNKKTP